VRKRKSTPAKNVSSSSEAALLGNGLELPIDDLTGKAVDRNMKPVTMLSLDDKWLGEFRGPRRVPSRLRNNVD
jgi:hypothetical protein